MPTDQKLRLNGKAWDSYLQMIVTFPLSSIRSDEHLEEL